MGSSEYHCHEVTKQTASRINFLGEQDAARKRGHPSQNPRPWAGAKCYAKPGVGTFVMTTQKKWDKAKGLVNDLVNQVIVDKLAVNHKSLERSCGFLCHLSRTYPAMFPYLKGFYNTLNSWRLGRDKDGWKMGKLAWWELMSGDKSELDDPTMFNQRKRKFIELNQKPTNPETIKAVPRMSFDLKALTELLSLDTPSDRLVRGTNIDSAMFMFGDALGKGFGSSWEHEDGMEYRFGVWGEDMDESSSNLRELQNLVETVELLGSQGKLTGKELFIFTDNKVSEAAFYNGSSKSELLFEFILRLRKLEMKTGTHIFISHVAGTRMKAQGTDGLSRGNLETGVMSGKEISS